MGQNSAKMAEKNGVAGFRRPVAGAGESSGELEEEGAWRARARAWGRVAPCLSWRVGARAYSKNFSKNLATLVTSSRSRWYIRMPKLSYV